MAKSQSRNPFCPNDCRCLDYTAQANVKFDCQGCPLEKIQRDYIVDNRELAGCFALLLAVFDKYSKPQSSLGSIENNVDLLLRDKRSVPKFNLNIYWKEI